MKYRSEIEYKHLKFIRSLPCLIKGTFGECEAAHIRHGICAMGMKPWDGLTVPLHYMVHKKQSRMPETKFWDKYGGIESAKELAINLYNHTGDREACIQIIAEWRARCFSS